MKTATLKRSTERLDNGTQMRFKIEISGWGSELFETREEAITRVEDLKQRGYTVAYFA